MDKFIPNSYYENIYSINYDALKKKKIKCIMFDLDNTLALIDEGIPRKRIEKFCRHFDSEFVAFALKPLSKGFRQIQKMKKYRVEEMCIIGDQLMTDIFGGNRFGCYTILVDPLGKKDLKVTTLNRFLENRILKKLSKRGILERGKYYE